MRSHPDPLPRSEETAFAARLLDPEAPPPPGLVTPAGGSVERRFAVYRNNVVVGLVDALAARFPVCRRLVGDDFFAAMARVYVLASPPRSPVMAAYGADFADFIAGFPPAWPLPYLPDVARLEDAVGRAYHATDAEPMRLPAFQAIPQEQWGDLVLHLHPSLILISSPYAIVSLWETNTRDATVRPVDAGEAQDALVVRPQLAVAVSRLPPGGHAFLAALGAGQPLATAAEHAASHDPAFELSESLVSVFTQGLAVDAGPGVRTPNQEDAHHA